MLRDYVEKWQGKRVMVVGDVCTDEWVDYRTSKRKNPEGDYPILVEERRESSRGMAALVSDMVSAIGGVSYLSSEMRSCLKTRIRIDGTSAYRMDYERKHYPVRLPINSYLVDYILIADYGKGSVDRQTIHQILILASTCHCEVIVDPARDADWTMYDGVTALKCNRQEWLAKGLPIRLHSLIVTEGERGCRLQHALLDSDLLDLVTDAPEFLPALTVQNPNVVGAGDQFLAALGLARCAGASWEDACRIANVAAGIKCRHERTIPCSKEELLAALE